MEKYVVIPFEKYQQMLSSRNFDSNNADLSIVNVEQSTNKNSSASNINEEDTKSGSVHSVSGLSSSSDKVEPFSETSSARISSESRFPIPPPGIPDDTLSVP